MSVTNLNDTTPAAPADGTNVKWQKDATDPVTLIRNASAYVPDATADSRGAIQLAGDLDGAAPAPKVVGLQGRAVDSAIPNNGDVLTWIAADNQWEPEAPSSATQPYDVVIALAGMPAGNTTYLIMAFTRVVNFPANFSGSCGKALTNPSASAVFTVKKNGAQIGTVAIATDGTFAFATSGGAAQSFATGDYMTIVTPDPQDATLADVEFTLAGTR